MNTLTYIDPLYSSKASISFGQFMLSVNIDGLETVNFIHSALPELIPTAPAKTISTVLSMSNTEQWMIALNFDQTLSRMVEAFRMRDFTAIADVIDELRQSGSDMLLHPYWTQVIRPSIISKAEELGIDTTSEEFGTVLTWAHPGNSSRRLHPRAIRFISHGLPDVLSRYRSSTREALTKTA